MEVPQKDPFLVRFYGRVGTGVGAGGLVLAKACLQAGFHVQAFADYPWKFLGEPATFSVRLSHDPFYQQQSNQAADIVLLLEEALEKEEAFRLEIAPEGWALVNTGKNAKEAAKTLSLAGRVFSFDASETAKYFIGQDLPNLALLGAFLKICPLLPKKALEEVVQADFADIWGKELAEKNIIALRMSYNEMEG